MDTPLLSSSFEQWFKENIMKHIAILIFAFITTSCQVTTETNNNYYSLEIDSEQACILKDYYLENNKPIPESVKKVLDEKNVEC